MSPATATHAPKRVLLAAPRGYCAGVDRAVQAVEHALDLHGPPVYVRKEIVHNKHVVEELAERGAIFVEEETEVPEGALVVFSAHGVAPSVHANAATRNLRTIDATCPLVTKVHVEARKFAEQGYTIVLIGHEGHEEVEGTTGEAPDSIVLVQTAEDVDTLEVADPDRVAFITQTTLSVDETTQIIERLRAKFPNITAPKSDDICYATTNRQIAVKQLARECDLVLVIGSTNSSNSNRLVEVGARARRRLAPDRQRHAGARGVAGGRRDGRHHVRRQRARGVGFGPGRLLPRAGRRGRFGAPHCRRGRPLHAPEGDPHRARGPGLSSGARPMAGGSIRRLLALASAIVFVDTMFFAAVVPILPALADEFDLSKSEAGVLTATYAAGTLLASLPSGWLAARIGPRRTVLVGVGLMSASSVALALAQEVWILDAARFVQGVGGAASWAGALSWLIGAAPSDRRGELIGTAMAAAIGGALFGPVLGGAAEAFGRGPVFALVGVAGVGLMVWALRTPAVASEKATGMREMGRALLDPRVAAGVWLVVLPGMTFGAMDVLVPLRLDVLGASAAAIAAVFLVAAGAEAVTSPIAGRVSDRVGRVLPSIVGLGASAALVALLALPDTAWVLAALVVALAPAIGILWAPAIAMLSDAAEARGVHQGFAFALTNLAWASGALIGSAGGAKLGEELGDATAYPTLAGLCLVTCALLAARRSRATAPA